MNRCHDASQTDFTGQSCSVADLVVDDDDQSCSVHNLVVDYDLENERVNENKPTLSALCILCLITKF